jgi:hypothetical protein
MSLVNEKVNPFGGILAWKIMDRENGIEFGM